MNNIKGLTNEEINNSRKKHGTNKIINYKKNTILSLLIESLSDPIVKILLIALGIKLLLLFDKTDLYETLGIAISIFLASIISVISEYGSEKSFEKLNEEFNLTDVKVIRNNNKQIININEIVVGDILLLEQGDKIPSDAIILEGEIYVDESHITGETTEKYKKINEEIYRGSTVMSYSCIAKTLRVGKNTYYGKIASSLQEKNEESILKIRLRKLAKQISIFGYIGAILVFISYMLNATILANNYQNIVSHIFYALPLSVAVIVMAVPEGLPMMITLVLSSNMKKLLRKNVLVRKLSGIETSGSLNILFTDKTGTLTEGKLKVIEIIDTQFKQINYNNDIFYQSLIYNNDSFFINNKIEGSNSTDRAILEYINNDKKDKYKILKKETFSSKTKYSSVTTNYNKETTFYKGAYEQIINNCDRYLENDKEKILLNKEELINKINQKTKEGIRVIALSYKHNVNNVLLGFVLLKDKIRSTAAESINKIESSGIQVIMLTGDSDNTAISIAKELNMIKQNDIVLTSKEFNELTDNQISQKLDKIKVLCRCLPEDKLRFIKIAQSKGLIVGMTGDGINDSPSLKKANVGYSMGSGTEVAKESSDVVIMDDDINSIYTAILYGRTIFKNIRKFITFQLTVNICAVLLSIIGPFIGVLSPITVIQVLWTNIVMDTFSGLAFSHEPALDEYMKEKPKDKNEQIINKYMINQILIDGLFSTLICIFFLKSSLIKQIYSYNLTDKYLLTAFFGLFIFLNIFLAFISRTSRINFISKLSNNKIFLLIFIFITIVQILLIYFGGELFRTTGLTIYEFQIMLLFSFLIIPIDMIRKIALKKRHISRTF